MNFERLSKKAVSYSSASMTKQEDGVRRAETGKSFGTPPIRKPGALPARSRIQVRIADTVVLPWVPETASTCLSLSTWSANHCGPET